MKIIAGVDEAGRGPLAGPVIAAAVILDKRKRILGIADSKLLTPEKRTSLALKIQEKCIAYAVGRADVSEIDELNIFHATLLAMRRAILALSHPPELIQIDGTHCPENLPYPAEAIIEGDRTVPVISAASIIAKVYRDREMEQLSELYPLYGFAKHKGYSTPEHLAALKKYGPCVIHRTSFAPVREHFITSV